MNLSELISELRERWRVELKECQDALLDPPRAKPNPLDRMIVEYDYLLVEAGGIVTQLETTNAGLLEALKRIADYENKYNDDRFTGGDAYDMQAIADKAIRNAEEQRR